jgi:uncharacterized MnhB-related membrane protein
MMPLVARNFTFWVMLSVHGLFLLLDRIVLRAPNVDLTEAQGM